LVGRARRHRDPRRPGNILGDASATCPKTKMIDRSGLTKAFSSGISSYDD
jgi:hypothetical protein